METQNISEEWKLFRQRLDEQGISIELATSILEMWKDAKEHVRKVQENKAVELDRAFHSDVTQQMSQFVKFKGRKIYHWVRITDISVGLTYCGRLITDAASFSRTAPSHEWCASCRVARFVRESNAASAISAVSGEWRGKAIQEAAHRIVARASTTEE